MSLSSENFKTIFNCTGGLTYDTNFKIFDDDDVEVILYTVASGVETSLIKTTHYSISLMTETGFRVTTVTAYSSLYKLIVKRNQPLKQEIDYTQNDIFSTEVLEDQLDKTVMMIQELKEQVNRGMLQDSSKTTPLVIPLPNAGKYLGWDSLGVGLENKIPSTITLGELAVIGDYSDNLTTALATIGATQKLLLINKAVTLTASVTVPSNVELWIVKGGSIVNPGGFTLTVNGPLDAGIYQIFSGFNAGDVTFGGSTVKEVYPQWWGALGDGATDDYIAINSAIQSGVKRVYFVKPTTAYAYGTTLTIPAATTGLNLIGQSSATVELRYTPATGNGIAFAGEADNFEIHNIYFSSPNSSTGIAIDYTGLAVAPLRDFIFKNITITGFLRGIRVLGGLNGRILLGNGRMSGQGKAVANGVGIQVGSDAAHAFNHCIIEGGYITSYDTNIYNAYCGKLHLKNPIIGTAVFGIRNAAITYAEGVYFEALDTTVYNEGSGYFWYDTDIGSVGTELVTTDNHRLFHLKHLPTRVKVHMAGNQAIATGGTPVLVALDTEDEDTEGLFTPTVTYKFTASNAGYYHIDLKIIYTATVDIKNYIAYIYKGGVAICTGYATSSGTAGKLTISISEIVWLDKGDIIQVYTEHDAGVNQNVIGAATNSNISIMAI